MLLKSTNKLLVYILGLLIALSVVNSWSPHVQANSSPINLQDFLKQNSDLSEFFNLIEKSPQFTNQLEWTHGTLFVPTNDALNQYKKLNPGLFNDYFLLYHFVNTLLEINSMEETSISTSLPASLPLWITKTKSSYIYLNNAKILRGDRRVRMGLKNTEQIVHVIDHVLEPTIPKINVGNSSINNPDAKKYMELSTEYSISGQYNTTAFYNQVKLKGKLNLFIDQGKNTFFLPVNDAFETTRIGSVDDRVIEGHMIVGKTIFLGIQETEPQQKHLTYETSAGAGNFPVQVTLEKIRNTNNWQVTSDNLVQESSNDNKPNGQSTSHRKGRVQAQILKANIPVKNGVVHLISRPLVVIDSNVYKTMEADNGPFKTFYELIRDSRDTQATNGQFENIRRILQDTSKDKRVTVFIPSSRVLLTSDNFQQLINQTKSSNTNERDKSLKQLISIIKLHIIQEDITSENIIEKSKNKTHPYSSQPLENEKQLFFNVIFNEKNARNNIAVVDSGGTSAMISQADIGATNGVLHQIDRILGIGDNTIYDRLKTDPILTRTYNLTHQGRFIEIFRSKNKEFTFFIPYNSAWDGVKYENPTAFHTLFQGEHEGTTKTILERHLIPAHSYSLEQLVNISNPNEYNKTVDLKTIRTLRGEIRIIRRNSTEYEKYNGIYGTNYPRANITRYHGPNQEFVIFWDGREVRIVAGNIKCSNGYIHVIDTVLMRNGDVVVNSVDSITTTTTTSITLSILFIIYSIAVGVLN